MPRNRKSSGTVIAAGSVFGGNCVPIEHQVGPQSSLNAGGYFRADLTEAIGVRRI